MSRNEKMKFIRLIEGSELCIGDALARYDLPRSTYYRWKRKLRTQGVLSESVLPAYENQRARTKLLVSSPFAVFACFSASVINHCEC